MIDSAGGIVENRSKLTEAVCCTRRFVSVSLPRYLSQDCIARHAEIVQEFSIESVHNLSER